MAEEDRPESVDRIVVIVERLGSRIISLLAWIVGLTFFVFAVFTAAYLYVLFFIPQQDLRHAESLERIERTMLSVWDKLLPIGATALRVIAPVILLLLALALLFILSRRAASPFELNKLISDLPSLLAILIVVAICLLPLAGLPVPDVLNNVALVVVGFYFGKRTGEGARGGGGAPPDCA